MSVIVKFFKYVLSFSVQLIAIMGFAILVTKLLVIIPIPDVFKSMDIIQLDQLDDGLLAAAASLKNQIFGTQGLDSNIVIVNTETINPTSIRSDITKAIRFLNNNGAKVIALDIAIDTPSTFFNPKWDTAFANALKEGKNVVGMNIIQLKSPDTDTDAVLALEPIALFKNCLSGTGYCNLELKSDDDPTGTILKFNPNRIFKGDTLKSFPLMVAMKYDSARAKILMDKTEKYLINFYTKDNFKAIWPLSVLNMEILQSSFAPLVKGKIFIFGYITPDEDNIKPNMFTTPIGKIDFPLVFAGIANDIIRDKFIPASPDEVDYLIAAFFGLFNLLFYFYASKKTVKLENFAGGGLLIPIEIVIYYCIAMFVYIFFDYKLGIIIPCIVIFVFVPLNALINNTISVQYTKWNAYNKYRKYPYPLVEPYLAIFKSKKSSIRHLMLLHNFQRLFWLLNSISRSAISYKNRNPHTNDIKSLSSFNNWLEMKEFCEKHSDEPINGKISRILSYIEELEKINNFIENTYYQTFNNEFLRVELYTRVEDETEIDPQMDVFDTYAPLLRTLVFSAASGFTDYSIIYVTQGEPGNYLVRDFTNQIAPPKFIQTQQTLISKQVYLKSNVEDLFIPLAPFVFYKMCKYHNTRELFVFAYKKYDKVTGKVIAIYFGEEFMCIPRVPPEIKSV